MRTFFISFLCLAVLIGSWLAFSVYADHSIEELIQVIDNKLLADAENENWEDANGQMETIDDIWHRNKKFYTFFLSTDAINQTDYSFARVQYYIKAEDRTSSMGELAYIKEQLSSLHKNETFTLENIF